MYLTPTKKKCPYHGFETTAEYKRVWYDKNRIKRITQEKDRRGQIDQMVKTLYRRAKKSAGNRRLDFTISPEDIILTEFCPLFPWVKLTSIAGEGFKDSNISLDRKDSSKGYIPGNVHIVSYKANRNKNNSTLEELIALGKWAQDVLDTK